MADLLFLGLHTSHCSRHHGDHQRERGGPRRTWPAHGGPWAGRQGRKDPLGVLVVDLEVIQHGRFDWLICTLSNFWLK